MRFSYTGKVIVQRSVLGRGLVIAFTLVLPMQPPWFSGHGEVAFAKSRSVKSATLSEAAIAEKTKQLNTLLQQLKEMRKQADEVWEKEMASNETLRKTKEGFWEMHAQDKAIDQRCRQIEFRIHELESSAQTSKENHQ